MFRILYLHLITSIATICLSLPSTKANGLHVAGVTLELNDVQYFMPPRPVGQIPGRLNTTASSDLGFTPITIITSEKIEFENDELKSLATNFSQIDDVFQHAFLEGIYIQNTVLREARFCDTELTSCRHMRPLLLKNSKASLPNGPYFMSSKGSIFQAYRLYPDSQGSFSETAISNSDGGFTVLPANLAGQSLAVAVPSRLYYRPTVEKPLSGVRLGVKDIYDLKGLKTSNGNRAWYNHYPASNRTASAVQNLIDAGAVVVGKMKTSQFANGETATADWVDYHSPFNPRGDGYQDGSSSSTGPASGEASYPWLDLTLGSDTGGSIRSPSQAQGLYGNRPSHGLVSMDGVMPLAPEFDTAGLFARDPRLWATAAKALYGHKITFGNIYPKAILTVGFPENASTPYNLMLNTFLKNLTNFLLANTTAYNVEDAWKADQVNDLPLPQFLNNTYELLTAKEQGRLVRDKFYTDYTKVHDGGLPHVNPSPLQRWAFGDNDTSTIEEVVAAKTKFMKWFNEKELPRDAKTCSKHLLVYVPKTPAPKYRDTYLTGPSRPFPFSITRLSVYSGAPDMVVPIGEVTYHSAITNRTEVLPASVDLMAAKGCDGMIFSLVRDLHAAGILGTVKTGRSIISGGNILL